MAKAKAKANKLPEHWWQCKSEAEEADWWDANASRVLEEAEKTGRMKSGTWKDLRVEIEKARAADLKRRSKPRTIAIRLNEGLVEDYKARAKAEGIPYQTLMRSVLHQELTK